MTDRPSIVAPGSAIIRRAAAVGLLHANGLPARLTHADGTVTALCGRPEEAS